MSFRQPIKHKILLRKRSVNQPDVQAHNKLRDALDSPEHGEHEKSTGKISKEKNSGIRIFLCSFHGEDRKDFALRKQAVNEPEIEGKDSRLTY